MKESQKTTPRFYFDWAATAIPLDGIDCKTDIFANPSSIHKEGRLAKEALEKARQRCARVLAVPPEKLYFTSGGTESNAIVLYSQIFKKGSVLYSGLEHPSVRENCLVLKKLKINTNAISVEKDGRVSEECFERSLEKNEDTRLAAVMGVNNETGVIMDLEALVKLARDHEAKKGPHIHFHADLVQALGKIPIDITGWDLDSASFSAHKLGGPRGIGLLYLKKPLESLYSGGEQENGIRPGTENTLGALAMTNVFERLAAPETVKDEAEKARERLKYLMGEMRKMKRCLFIPEDREDNDERFSPWILQVRFRDVPGAVMVRSLDDSGVAVSTGSACSLSSPDRPVLSFMGLNDSAQLEGFRISQGWATEKSDMDALLNGLEKALTIL